MANQEKRGKDKNTKILIFWGRKELFRWKISQHFSQLFIGALAGLRQFLTTESTLKMPKNAFISPELKALSVLKVFKFLFWFFGLD